jgi:CheY-like chemotaxis protein
VVTKTILLLVVEDEPLILELAATVLIEGGFEVITASNGTEAVAALEQLSESLAGLVTDIRLGPEPDGWAIARHARELNGSLAVVYTTGDSAAEWTANGVPKSLVVQKPYASAQLVTAISTLLTETDTAS